MAVSKSQKQIIKGVEGGRENLPAGNSTRLLDWDMETQALDTERESKERKEKKRVNAA